MVYDNNYKYDNKNNLENKFLKECKKSKKEIKIKQINVFKAILNIIRLYSSFVMKIKKQNLSVLELE